MLVKEFKLCNMQQTYISREVAGLIALSALNTLSRTRFGTLFSGMTLLLAVLAGKWIDTLFGAVAGTMAFLLAVNALGNWLDRLAFDLFLLAVLMKRLV